MRDPQGEGERAEKARSRRFTWIVALLMIAGAVLGAAHAILTRGEITGPLPGPWAVVLALVYAASVLIGSWYFFRSVDEVEIRDNLLAGTIALYVYMIVYPCWYLLWKGGLLPVPMHEALFAITWLAAALGYLAKKIRP